MVAQGAQEMAGSVQTGILISHLGKRMTPQNTPGDHGTCLSSKAKIPWGLEQESPDKI